MFVGIDERLPTPTLARGACQVARDTAQPWPESFTGAKPIELAPRGDEGLLRDGLAEPLIAGGAVRNRGDDILIASDEIPKGIVLTTQAGLDQLDVASRTEAVVVATQRGLLRLPS